MNRQDLLRANAEYGLQTAGLESTYAAPVTTDLTTSKLQSLETLKQAKIDRLAGPKTQTTEVIPVTGLYDADTLYIANPYTSTAKDSLGKEVTGARLAGVDAPELKVDGQLTRDGINARIQADSYMMGVDAPNFPEGEGLEPQYYDLYTKYMNPALEQRAAEGKFQAKPTGYQGHYGRDLFTGHSEEMPQDMASYLVDKGQAIRKDYSGIQDVSSPRYVGTGDGAGATFESGGKTYKFTDTGLEEVKASKDAGGFWSSLKRAPKAFVAGAGNIALGTADMVVEATGRLVADTLGYEKARKWDIANEDEVTKAVNETIGYDNEYTAQAVEEIGQLMDQVTEDATLMDISTWGSLVKEGRLGKIGDMIATAFQTPEMAAYSLGYIIPALFDPSRKTKLGAELAAVAGKSGMSPAAKRVAAKRVMSGASVKDKLAWGASKVAGHSLVAADMTNKQLDEFIENNAGKEATYVDVGRMFGINLGLLIPDVMSTRFALNPKRAKAIIDKLPDGKLASFTASSINTAGKLAQAGLAELAQEFSQTMGEVFNTQYNTEDYKDKSVIDLITDETNLKEAAVGGVMGMAGAVHMGMPSAALDTARAARTAAKVEPKVPKLPDRPTLEEEEELESTSGTPVGKRASPNEALKEIEKRVLQDRAIGTTEDLAFLNALEDRLDSIKDEAIRASVERRVKGIKSQIVQRFNQLSDEEAQGYTLGSKKTAMEIVEAAAGVNTATRNQTIDKLVQLGAVDKEFADKAKKSFDEVNQETTTGKKGYKTYEVMLEELNKNPEENASLINTYRTRAANFQASQAKYVDALEQAITVTLREANALSDPNTEYVSPRVKVKKRRPDGVPTVVEYEVPGLTQTDGNPVVVIANRAGSDTAPFKISKGIQAVLDSKKVVIAELERILSSGVDTASEVEAQPAQTTPVRTSGQFYIDIDAVLERSNGDVQATRDIVVNSITASDLAQPVKTRMIEAANKYLNSKEPNIEATLVVEDGVKEDVTTTEENTESTNQTQTPEDSGTPLVPPTADEQLVRENEWQLKADKLNVWNNLKRYKESGKYNEKTANRFNGFVKQVAAEIRREIGRDFTKIPKKERKLPTQTRKLKEASIANQEGETEASEARKRVMSTENEEQKLYSSYSDEDFQAMEQQRIEADEALQKTLAETDEQPSVEYDFSKMTTDQLVHELENTTDEARQLALEEAINIKEQEEAALNLEKQEKIASNIERTKELLSKGAKPKLAEEPVASTVLKPTSKGMVDLSVIEGAPKVYIRRISDMIEELLKEVLAESLTGYNQLWVEADSPLRMLANNKGKLPREVVEAIAVAVIDFRSSTEGNLITNTKEDVAKLLGKEVYEVPHSIAKELKNVGKPETLMATTIGNKVLTLLGITVNKDTAAYGLKERLAADIGGTTLRVLTKRGILAGKKVISADLLTDINNAIDAKEVKGYKLPNPAEIEIPITTYSVPAGSKAKSINDQKAYREVQKDLDRQMKGDSLHKGPRTRKTSGKKKFQARNSEEITVVSDKTNKVLNTAENTPFITNEAGKQLAAMWGENRSYDEATDDQLAVMKLFGWIDINPETTVLHVDKRTDADMDNQTLFRKLSHLADYMEKNGDMDTYFDYFVAKSGRVFVDSATVNPQTDKIARFIVTVKARNQQVRDLEAWKLAVVQAFDGDREAGWVIEGVEMGALGAIDKQSTKSSIRQFEEVIKDKKVEAALESIRSGEPDNRVLMAAVEGVDHPSHALAALYDMAKYVDAGSKEGFESRLVIEADGVTSGVFLGHLVNPVGTDYDELKAILTRGGMLFEGTNADTYGEWKEKGGQDTYQVAIDPINEMIEPFKRAIKNLVKVNRSFMKGPVMVFFYGAGAGSIKRAIASGEVGRIMDSLSKDDTDVENVIAVLKDRNASYTAELNDGPKEGRAKYLEKVIRKNDMAIDWLTGEGESAKVRREVSMVEFNSPMTTISNELHTEIANVYGRVTVTYLEKTYKDARNTQKAMNMVFTGAFGVFKRHYEIELAELLRSKDRVLQGKQVGRFAVNSELADKSVADIIEMIANGDIRPTVADREAIIQKLLKDGKVPGILTVDADSSTNIAAITKQERVGAGNTNNVSLKVKGKNGHVNRTVNPLIYEYVANPVAGGVLNIHYFDSAMIQRIVAMGTGLGVHDAWVTHPNQVRASGKIYNTAVWEESQRFNMMEKVLEKYNEIRDNPADFNAFIDAIFDDEHMRLRVDPFAKEMEMGKDEYIDWSISKLENILITSVNNIRVNRQKLANENFKLAQMAGPEGIEYVHTGVGKEVEGSYMEFKSDGDLLLEITGKTKDDSGIMSEELESVSKPKSLLTEAERAVINKLTPEQQAEAAKELNNCS